MKNLLLLFTAITVVTACQKANTTDKHKQLADLKKQQSVLNEKIKKLETEVSANDTTKKNNTVLVSAETIGDNTFQHFIEVQGRVESDQNVAISARMPGTIQSVLVAKGDKVSRGQVLATMDAQVMLSQIESLKSNLRFATTMFEKQKNLWDQKIGTEVQFLSAKNNKESLEKQLQSLQDQYDMSRIKSPINGTVDDVMTKIGESVAPGFPSFRVVNLTNMKVVADVAENYAAKLNAGDEVAIRFPDINKEIKRKITAVSKVINPSTRSFNVEIKLTGEDQSFFHPNMIAVLKISDYLKDKSIMVPINIVQNSEEGKFVYIAVNENGKLIAKKQKVQPGLAYGGNMEITDGLKKGDQLITAGYQDLNDGQLITVTTAL